jgi:hypothetical protein
MSVYVDDMRAPYGRMVMCHMTADSSEELLAMARTIGVSERWIQEPGTWQEHFDISLGKRALAVKAGAVEATGRERVMAMIEKREAQANGDH